MTALTLSRSLDIHRDALATCRRCALEHVDARPILSLARAPRVMLVGQAPGKTEITASKPFAGRAGRTLFSWLDRAGLDEETARREIYIAAMTRCYPGPHPSGRGDRVPSKLEQQQCGDWLEAELRIIRPKVLILVGKLAIERFLDPAPLDEIVGREHGVSHAGGTSIAIPLPHPSGASSWIHGPGHKALVEGALRLLRARLGNAGVRGIRDADTRGAA